MTLDELKQVTIDYFVNLQRIKKPGIRISVEGCKKQISISRYSVGRI